MKFLAIILSLLIPASTAANLHPSPGPGRAAVGGASYLIDEGFEGTGAPSGWSSTGTVDWDEATIVHDGSQSFQVDSTTIDGYGHDTFTGAADIYGEFWYYADHIPSTDAAIFRILNGTTEIGRIRHRAAGTLQVLATGGTNVATTLSTGEDTWVRIWFHFTQGSGTNATMRVWWATTDTHPGNGDAQYFAQSTNGTSTSQGDAIRLFSDNIGTSNGSRYFDNLTVDDAILW